MNNEISFTEKRQPKHYNLTRSRRKYHGDNAINNNHNIGNRLSNKKRGLDNFEILNS